MWFFPYQKQTRSGSWFHFCQLKMRRNPVAGCLLQNICKWFNRNLSLIIAFASVSKQMDIHESFLYFRMKYIWRRHEIFFYVKTGYLRSRRVPFIQSAHLLFQLTLKTTPWFILSFLSHLCILVWSLGLP